MINMIISFLGLIIGGLIGVAFGAIQNAASIKNSKRKSDGKPITGLSIIPGSFGRVSFLMIALLLVQVGLPMIFDGYIKWIVSAGVVLGYGFMLYLQFYRRLHSSPSDTLFI